MLGWLKRMMDFGSAGTAPVLQQQADNSPRADLVSAEARESVKGDSPIRNPDDDLLSIDPFAKAIAEGIASSDASDGIVYAINGTWGSGKSSAINLIFHHLSRNERIVTVAFNPWWFSGAESLTFSFFQEMQATIGKSVDERAREAMASSESVRDHLVV